MGRGNFGGNEEPIVSIVTLCRELCKNGWTDRFPVWIVDSGGPKEAQVHPYSSGGATVSTWEGTLAPTGEYDWTVRLWQRCSLMWNYFDHLLIFSTTCVLLTVSWVNLLLTSFPSLLTLVADDYLWGISGISFYWPKSHGVGFHRPNALLSPNPTVSTHWLRLQLGNLLTGLSSCFRQYQPSDSLERVSWKWPILCRVGCKTITQIQSLLYPPLDSWWKRSCSFYTDSPTSTTRHWVSQRQKG